MELYLDFLNADFQSATEEPVVELEKEKHIPKSRVAKSRYSRNNIRTLLGSTVDSSTDSDSSDDSIVRKKRGRPRNNAAVDSDSSDSVVRKKRGRPRNNVIVDAALLQQRGFSEAEIRHINSAEKLDVKLLRERKFTESEIYRIQRRLAQRRHRRKQGAEIGLAMTELEKVEREREYLLKFYKKNCDDILLLQNMIKEAITNYV